IELIVFDDGSKDNSANLIEALSKKHHFFFQRQKNIGLTATSNNAIKLCKGKYVAFLGSDDLFFEDKIEKQVEFMEGREDIAGCGGNIVNIDATGKLLEKQKRKPYREINFQTMFTDRKIGPPAPTAMIRLDVLREIGGYDPDIKLEDLYLWLKITHYGYKLAVLADDLVYYRKHDSNAHKDLIFMSDSIIEIYEQYHEEVGYPYAYNKVLISMFLKLSKRDKTYALGLLKKISLRFYNLKVLRGVFALIKP
ncbi:MAG: glycosyltransferase family 2 protein, partial [Methylococcaceae bacterium]